jgi:decaprenyl-phosphate phosphoribosyltransferase
MIQTLRVLRLEHWPKNIFTVLGSIAAIEVCGQSYSWTQAKVVALGFLLSCLVSSVNYVMNEFLDAPRDAEHPTKKHRPIPSGAVNPHHLLFAASWFLIAAVAVAAWLHNWSVSLGLMVLFGSGILYNVKPARFKEVPVLDVIVESLNNPIRLTIGWYATQAPCGFPSLLLLFLFWIYGAFLMSAKRLAEQRFLGERASNYRITYCVYTPRVLLVLTMLYGMISFFLFLSAARGEGSRVVLTAPLVALQLVWVVKLSLERESVMMDPERAYRKPWFFLYSFLVLGLIIYLASNTTG